MNIKKRLADYADRKKRESDLAIVFGKDSIDKAYDLAIEAGKIGLVVDDLYPMVKSYNMLQILGIPRLDDDTVITWGARNGFISAEDIRVAQSLDLLGMNDGEGVGANQTI